MFDKTKEQQNENLLELDKEDLNSGLFADPNAKDDEESNEDAEMQEALIRLSEHLEDDDNEGDDNEKS